MSASTLIALISQKGGSGKTTVAMQLAAGLSLAGYRVALADLDPQESASRWAESAAPDTPFPAPVVRLNGTAKQMAAALAPLSKRVDVVILDCPPSMEHPHTHSALALCDVALVPVVPSPTDLWATRAIERLIVDQQEQRPQLKGALLPNRVMRTTLAADVLEVLADFALPVLDAALSQRSAYALSAVHGTSVFGLGRTAAAAQQEVDRLITAILTMIGE